MDIRHDKRMLAVPVLLMIALSILGVAYAHWQDMIKINGIVNTGTLNVGWVEVWGVDKEEKEALPKDVGNYSVGLDEWFTDVHTNKTAAKKLWVNITNGYPSYYVEAWFMIRNVGTVPAVIVNFTITPEPPLVAVYAPTALWPDRWELRDTSKAGDPVALTLVVVNLVGEQLEPCIPEKGQIDTYINQTAQECHTYKYHAEFGIVNWDP